MSEIDTQKLKQELKAWTKKTLDRGVHDLIDQGLYEEAVIEAKPAWILPYTLVIGKVRSMGSRGSFSWFLCGDCPTTHVHSDAATSPREAARHIALKWQLQVENNALDVGIEKQQLLEQAEALYEISQATELWGSDAVH